MTKRRRIFVSYRRDDCAAYAGWLAHTLESTSDCDVFLDVDDVQLGEDFGQRIEDEIRRCDGIIVLIGPAWLSAAGSGGGPRIFDDADWVHLEIKAALERGLPIVPVLVGRARIPAPAELPEGIRPMAYRHAIELRESSWAADVAKLVTAFAGNGRAEGKVGTTNATSARASASDSAEHGSGGPDALAVVEHVARRTGFDRAWIAAVLESLHDAIDRFVMDDFTVIIPPLLIHRRGDPVAALMARLLFEDPAEGLEGRDDAELATQLGIPQERVSAFPVAWIEDILLDLMDRRGLDVDSVVEDEAQWTSHTEPLLEIVTAWSDCWSSDPPILREVSFSSIRASADVASWLERNLSRLARVGIPVTSDQKSGLAASDGDSACTFANDTKQFRRGDRLLIRTFARMADLESARQFAAEIATRRRSLPPGSPSAYGLLIADGISVEAQEALKESGVYYNSLVSIGFRDDWRDVLRPRDRDYARDPVRATESRVIVLPPDITHPVETQKARKPKNAWNVEGVEYTTRTAANKALAASMGTYTRAEWEDAQRRHDLR